MHRSFISTPHTGHRSSSGLFTTSQIHISIMLHNPTCCCRGDPIASMPDRPIRTVGGHGGGGGGGETADCCHDGTAMSERPVVPCLGWRGGCLDGNTRRANETTPRKPHTTQATPRTRTEPWADDDVDNHHHHAAPARINVRVSFALSLFTAAYTAWPGGWQRRHPPAQRRPAPAPLTSPHPRRRRQRRRRRRGRVRG